VEASGEAEAFEGAAAVDLDFVVFGCVAQPAKATIAMRRSEVFNSRDCVEVG
jgi:hypothetical protein